MTNQTQTIPNYEVHCGRCKWWGYMSQLVTTYEPSVDDVSAEPGCPMCMAGIPWLEFRENRLEESLINLALAEQDFKDSMENLHCQISQQQS